MYMIHCKPGCPWCEKAKDLLSEHKIEYEVKTYTTPAEIALFKSNGYKTFPQVFDDAGKHIGGFEALSERLHNDDF